jgi:hypothetical protein
MPWQHVTPMSQRKEFVNLAMTEGANRIRPSGQRSYPKDADHIS